jgi:hypothetical protein
MSNFSPDFKFKFKKLNLAKQKSPSREQLITIGWLILLFITNFNSVRNLETYLLKPNWSLGRS